MLFANICWDDACWPRTASSEALVALFPKYHEAQMAHFPQPHAKMRAPRVRVSGGKPIKFSLGNKDVPATLEVISATGGRVSMPRGLRPGTLAEAFMARNAGPLTGVVELLAMKPQGKTVAQAFRFLALSDNDYSRLTDTLGFYRWRATL